jgi:hypothetical protein
MVRGASFIPERPRTSFREAVPHDPKGVTYHQPSSTPRRPDACERRPSPYAKIGSPAMTRKPTAPRRTRAPAPSTPATPPTKHAAGGTTRPEIPYLEGRTPLPEELTGRASGTDDNLVALFDNPTAEHMSDGFRGGSEDIPRGDSNDADVVQVDEDDSENE